MEKIQMRLWLITAALFGTGLITGIVMKYKNQYWYLLFGCAISYIIKMFLDFIIREIEGHGKVIIKIR